MRTFLLTLLCLSLASLAACGGPRLPETCYLKPESGQCRASIPRWYLDDRTRTCKAFIWGGCGGVAPFETLESCTAQCMPGAVITARPAAPGKNPPADAAPAAADSPAAPAMIAPAGNGETP